MCALSIKVAIRKKSGNLFNDPRNWSQKIDKKYNQPTVLNEITELCKKNMQILVWGEK